MAEDAQLITNFSGSYYSILKNVNRRFVAYMTAMQSAAIATQSHIERITAFDLINWIAEITASSHGFVPFAGKQRAWARVSGIAFEYCFPESDELLTMWLDVIMQKRIEIENRNYFADFALSLHFQGPNWKQSREWRRSVFPLTGTNSYRRKIVVEVDGGEFHNNPEAIEHDKSRDRDFKMLGIDVFRFTGGEIVKNNHVVSSTVETYIKAEIKRLIEENRPQVLE